MIYQFYLAAISSSYLQIDQDLTYSTLISNVLEHHHPFSKYSHIQPFYFYNSKMKNYLWCSMVNQILKYRLTNEYIGIIEGKDMGSGSDALERLLQKPKLIHLFDVLGREFDSRSLVSIPCVAAENSAFYSLSRES